MTELIMVHGTWSNRKIWESRFAKHLVELLRLDVRVRPFEWSGRNSVSAREKASSDFIEFVRAGCVEEPSDRRIVICHSHGGSIVMRALALESTLPVDALVCIGMPFIHVSRLEEVVPGATPPFGPIIAILGIVCVLFIAQGVELIGFTGLRHAAAWMMSHPLLVLTWLFAAMMVFIAFTLVLVVKSMAPDRSRLDFETTEEYVDGLLKEPSDEVWILKKRCQLPTSEPVPTLLIRTPGDEAHGFLAAAQMASLLARTLYGLPLRVLGTTGSGYDFEDVGILELPVQLLRWSAAFTWRAFVSIPIVLATALTFLPFGIEFSRLAGRVLVPAGDAQPGRWTVTYVSPFDRYEERTRRTAQYEKARDEDDGLAVERMEKELASEWTLATRGIAHSRAYNDLRSAKIIAAWLQRRLSPATAS